MKIYSEDEYDFGGPLKTSRGINASSVTHGPEYDFGAPLTAEKLLEACEPILRDNNAEALRRRKFRVHIEKVMMGLDIESVVWFDQRPGFIGRAAFAPKDRNDLREYRGEMYWRGA